MKIYRVRLQDRVLYGVLDQDRLIPVSGSIIEDFTVGGESIPFGGVLLLPPVAPSKIVAVGLNYKDHAMERGKPLPEEPLLFLKPSTSVIGPFDAIVYPKMSKRVDYEGELAVVIKKRVSLLADDEPVDPFILGYTCFNDVTPAISRIRISNSLGPSLSIRSPRSDPASSRTSILRPSRSKPFSTANSINPRIRGI
jgi:hypothetical protein